MKSTDMTVSISVQTDPAFDDLADRFLPDDVTKAFSSARGGRAMALASNVSGATFDVFVRFDAETLAKVEADKGLVDRLAKRMADLVDATQGDIAAADDSEWERGEFEAE